MGFCGPEARFRLAVVVEGGEWHVAVFPVDFSLQLGDRPLSYVLAVLILIGVLCIIAVEEGTRDSVGWGGDEIVLV